MKRESSKLKTQNSKLKTQNSKLVALYRFFRFSAFGATATLPLLGAADAPVGWGEIGMLLAVACCFHGYAYVSNDLVDLPVDRLHPLRQGYPLVRGTIKPWQALVLALALLLGAFLFNTVRTGQALLLLVVAIVLMTAYNLWGKRCPFPPFTDLLQGLGWAALLLWGATASGNGITPLVWALAAHQVALIMLVNGVHGGLRDLASDAVAGAHTTALLLGAQPTANGGAKMSPLLLGYAIVWQLLAIIALGVPLVGNWMNYDLWLWGRTALPLVGLLFLVVWVARASRANNDSRAMIALGMLHLIAALSAPLILTGGLMNGPLLVTIWLVHSVPLLANGMTYDALGWLLGVRNESAMKYNDH
jgi:4-hydroxybenzoate polyprenyltransferase